MACWRETIRCFGRKNALQPSYSTGKWPRRWHLPQKSQDHSSSSLLGASMLMRVKDLGPNYSELHDSLSCWHAAVLSTSSLLARIQALLSCHGTVCSAYACALPGTRSDHNNKVYVSKAPLSFPVGGSYTFCGWHAAE